MQPNGYKDIVAAGEMMVEGPQLSHRDMSLESHLGIVAKIQPALSKLRKGLSIPCEKPLDYHSEQSALVDFQAFRLLALGLISEGQLAVRQGQFATAAHSNLDVITLAHCIERGGLLTDWLVARALEAMGTIEIANIRSRMGSDECMSVAGKLIELEQNREAYASVKRRDIAWSEITCGWPQRFDHLLQKIWYGDVGDRHDNINLKSQSVSRLLILELEIHGFQRRNGFWPDRLDEAITQDWVKHDPLAGDNSEFLYVRVDGGFQLCGVRSDGIDDNFLTLDSAFRSLEMETGPDFSDLPASESRD